MACFEGWREPFGTATAWDWPGKAAPGLNAGQPGAFESWPVWEQSRRFDLGHVLNCAVIDLIEPAEPGALGIHHAGLWQCDLADNSLTWSGGVYDIFGLPRTSPITREQALAHFSSESRASLERLRSYAIRNRRGFTIDVEIRARAIGESRAVRIIGAPVCEGGRVVGLHGLKLII